MSFDMTFRDLSDESDENDSERDQEDDDSDSDGVSWTISNSDGSEGQFLRMLQQLAGGSNSDTDEDSGSDSDLEDQFFRMLQQLAENMLLLTLPQDEMAPVRRALQSNGKFNVAVCGLSGTGKSSLINAMRNVTDTDPTAAPVGEVETTTTVTAYDHPYHPHIVFWDVPGGGTDDSREENYFYDKVLFDFDCLMLVSSDRFCQIDVAIAKEAERFGKPMLFVRNKSDLAIASKMRRKRLTHADAMEEFRDETAESCRKEILEKVDVDDAYLYLVSCVHFNNPSKRIDEHNLMAKIGQMAASQRS